MAKARKRAARKRTVHAPPVVRAARTKARPARSASDAVAAPRNHQRPPYAVVALGASAGGLEALKQVLRPITRDVDMAFVVVQHLAPNQQSLLPELLNAASKLPVVIATEGVSLRSNRVHVIPPNVHMTVVDGRLHLAPRPTDRRQHNPIDVFLESLATYAGERAVAVILSGTASDGAIGVREVKAAGGYVLVQDPGTTDYTGMPRAAIATGVADLVLPPQQIGEELVRLGGHPFVASLNIATEPDLPITEQQLAHLFYLLRTASGVDFTHYKLPTIKRRLQRRMAIKKTTDIDIYLKLLESDGAEVHNLYRDVLIHVTRFFRDPESFSALKAHVFPSIVEEAVGKRPIRIWIPGCATGEEAYSVAIALIEFLGEDANSVPIQVFATDVSEDAIDRARAGLYPETIAADVSPDRLRRFFSRVDGHYRVSKIVRDSCIFARQDLTRDPPFSKLDLIVCRNVLIYLGQHLQQKLMAVFHYALKPAGYLMLGATESIGPHAELFGVLDKRHRIYTRRSHGGRVEFEVPAAPERDGAGPGGPPRLSRAGRTADLQTEVTRLLLARYSPPGVLVDQDFQIVQTRGKTGPFLELAAGEASLNLLKMARRGLLPDLRGALLTARKTRRPVKREDVAVKNGDAIVHCDLHVVPVEGSDGPMHYLVLFEPAKADVLPPATRKGKSKGNSQLDRLEQQLSSGRDYLQSIIQDLEAANEELQSANEEILSSNEELQSTNEELDTAKEELQSTNEELNTVNEELNTRNEELSHLNNDLINLLGAVPAAIVIVSADLRIRRFTPLAEQVLNLIPTDVGRPLSDIRPNIELPDLADLTLGVIETIRPEEREVGGRAGRRYLVRIRPYKDQDNRIKGAVLVLTEFAVPRPVP